MRGVAAGQNQRGALAADSETGARAGPPARNAGSSHRALPAQVWPLKPLKRWIKALLGSAGYLLVKKRDQVENNLIDGLYTLHNDHFRNDPAFRAAYARGVQASAGVDPQFHWRVHTALWVASPRCAPPAISSNAASTPGS